MCPQLLHIQPSYPMCLKTHKLIDNMLEKHHVKSNKICSTEFKLCSAESSAISRTTRYDNDEWCSNHLVLRFSGSAVPRYTFYNGGVMATRHYKHT